MSQYIPIANRILSKRTNDTGTKIPVLADDLDELLIRLLTCAIGVNEDRQRLSNTDSVGKLDKCAASQSSGNKRLG